MADSVMWFRRDLRLADHPALAAAAAAGRVLPLFVLDPRLLASAGDTRRNRLFASLRALHSATDGALVVRTGKPAEVLPTVARELGAASVHVSGEPSPFGRRRDAQVRKTLQDNNINWVVTGTPYAVGPGRVRKDDGTPYRVFTPFSKSWRDHGWPAPAAQPDQLRWVRGVESDDLPAADHDPRAGEQAAIDRWAAFAADDLARYDTERDRPDLDSTSRLSEHLKYGELHPRTLLAELAHRRGDAVRRFVTELCWREFYADVLWHQPKSAWHDLNPLPMHYAEPAAAFESWQRGTTGFPMVDAGMRQLAGEGWMHNRLRMITASFLVKHLHVWWPHGARHFLNLLRDGDIASNNHGWQWVAGTGTDASPYFRIFNPVSQGIKFDPDGEYVRRWIPELGQLPGKAAHQPWNHQAGYLRGYPKPIIDLATERTAALDGYAEARR
ncbi:MAG: DNA photolyase family protein [Actinomycetota bacterium]|nr:DNA photolyase family protein [Actinomycetota bacterium]